MGLWVRAGAFCAQQLTDGFVPDHMIASLGTPAQAERLVKVRLWLRQEGGFLFHEWSESGRQPLRADVEAEREAARKRMAERRNKRRSDDSVRQNTDRTSGEVLEKFGDGSATPTRPDPTRPPVPSEQVERGKRAARLTDEWTPNDAHRSLAAERGVSIDFELSKFRDWAASNGAAKKDWDATFRNWLRNARPTPGVRPTATRDPEKPWRDVQWAK